MTGKNFEERRKFVRLKAHHLLKYKLMDKEEALSFARNISAGGVLFHAEEFIPEGSMVELLVNFPSYPGPIKAVAKVVRVVPLPKVGGFDIGAEFVNIEEKAREYMNQKIRKVDEEAK
jgi:c-di-GMP-binding flagellar brake protein YcgR